MFKKDGTTYVKELDEREGDKQEVYYAIFEYLIGDDKYTWDNPVCTEDELRGAARVLAQYHSAVHDLQYEGKRYEAKIIDDDGRELGVDEVGTLLIKGDSIANGYWNKHEQTKDTFRGEWINTHDKFRRDADGYFWYAGRTDDMMKVSGLAVWPADVESILASHEAVLESGVVGVPDKEGLIKPRAYVVLKDKEAASEELVKELQRFV